VVAIAGVASSVAFLAPPAGAATFDVTSTNDSGPGSLRQAVADANLAPGADTISFAVGGTIRLTSGIAVSSGLALEGPGADLLTVSGGGTSPILFASATTNLTISGLTLADGAAPGQGGGAINNNGGTVTVSDTVFLRNTAFAGGAIENVGGGTMTIANSTFSGNSALPGGAISNYGATLAVVNSTFVGNSAVVGGAIYNLSFATIRVTNSTFSGNTASEEGPALDNSGGLTITVENTLFANNGCAGPVTDGGGNLDWPDTACPGVNGDSRLGALADNGGSTPTMALAPGSAAIDTAIAAICPATDQRGIARPVGAGCDIGAYEADVLDEVPPVLTTPARIVVDATGPDGAAVSYAASAVDDVDGPVTVTCLPPSGATFAIGTTTVTCTASDSAGNVATASFDVHVKGAGEQLDDLIAAVESVGRPGSSLAHIVVATRALLDRSAVEPACRTLAAFTHAVRALERVKKVTPPQATELTTRAARIRSVLSC